MKYIKLFDAYQDIAGKGSEHIAYEIDSDWILKIPLKSYFYSNKERLKKFNNHIRIMKKYPEIFVEVKKLDNYRASVEKVDTKRADEEIKYFYECLLDFIMDNRNDQQYLDFMDSHINYKEVLFKMINSYFRFNRLYENFKSNNTDPIIIKWLNFIDKIKNSHLMLEADYIDAMSWNFGIDKNGNIKMIDF